MTRDTSLDILRGIAIFSMVGANSVGYIFTGDLPLWFRMYSSVAAPLFILLAGYMTALSVHEKKYPFVYFLKRGLVVFLAGIFLEIVVWRIYPFTVYDILYVIALSIPVGYLFLRIQERWIRWLCVLAIYLAAPVLRHFMGYTDYPLQIEYLTNTIYHPAEHPTNIFNHFIIDGWFPVFSWLGVFLLGIMVFDLRKKYSTCAIKNKFLVLCGALSFIALGSVIWNLVPSPIITRGDYCELFYPPTFRFFFIIFGIILLLFMLIDSLRFAHRFLLPLAILGRSSLMIYVLHYVLLELGITNPWADRSFAQFLLFYVLFILLLFICSCIFLVIKKRWTTKPFVLKVLLGG